MNDLYWLPRLAEWTQSLAKLEATPWNGGSAELVRLAGHRMTLPELLRLDRAAAKILNSLSPQTGLESVRLALLGTATLDHLLPGVRAGALRRRLAAACYTTPFGQYRQEIETPDSGLAQFRPEAVLFSFDPSYLAGEQPLDALEAQLASLWTSCQERFRSRIIQQTFLPSAPAILGENEHRFPHSLAARIAEFNWRLRSLADRHGVTLLCVDQWASRTGLDFWRDDLLWHRAKQDIGPRAAILYGDLVGRILGSLWGKSAKCLVLDLDNTLWGGVAGDDGLTGIKLGQGGGTGEAFVAMQQYCRKLASRGIILAVCSKNEESVARKIFSQHPEMVLRLDDVACFVANWEPKPDNLRQIARALNIGLDALVFADDSPFEREIVRTNLPMLHVPELPEEAAFYPRCLADAGYFEGMAITSDDLARTRQYGENSKRAELQASASDLPAYLRSLDMELRWANFDEVSLQRITQLINKTNQFNLTTRRYTEEQVRSLIGDPSALTLQLRLTDRLGDNGIIAIVIGRLDAAGDLRIDTWLMSCRVFGRTVEHATLNILAAHAREMGATRLMGDYRPTEKNAIVAQLYASLGFEPLAASDAGSQWHMRLDRETTLPTFVRVKAPDTSLTPS